MVQLNYPYPTDFEQPLPAWPNKAACAAANTPMESDIGASNGFDWSNIEAIGKAY